MVAFLIGGGRDPDGVRASHAPFAAAVSGGPVVVLMLDEEGAEAERWTAALAGVGAESRVVVVSPGGPPAPEHFEGAGGCYVAGGWTPGYQEVLAGWSPPQLPYAGFSAGAAVAASRALVGGWRVGTLAVCSEDAGEDLDQVEVRDGLGLLDGPVDVHCAQWGTLPRLIAAVEDTGWGIDEHTALEVRDGIPVAVHGDGAVYRVRRTGDDVALRAFTAGAIA